VSCTISVLCRPVCSAWIASTPGGSASKSPAPRPAGSGALQERAAGEGVEGGDRLVEDQQLRPFRGRHGQGELGALAAGQPPGLLRRVQADLVDAPPRQLAVPGRVQPGAQAQVVADRQPRVHRGVLRDEADPGQLRRVRRGAGARRLRCQAMGALGPPG
jgi:hypothetical protein